MSILQEGRIACEFPDDWEVTKYDDWAFYRKQFVSCCGTSKAIDFLAYRPQERELWLIEIKDFRQHQRTKELPIWEDVALKARDTLAGLFAAKVHVHDNQNYAARVVRAHHIHVVFHLEQPRTNNKLFRRAFDPANVQQKLKQILRPIDAHPKVIELDNMEAVPWSARSA